MKQKINLGRLLAMMLICLAAITTVLSSCSNSSSQTTQKSTSPGNSSTTNTGANGTSLSISVDKSNVNPGDNFTVNVLIDSPAASRGVQCALNFDPSAMQCNSATEGNFYKDWASANGLTTTAMPTTPTIDNTQGTVADWAVSVMGQVQGAAFSGSAGGAQGQGIVFSYNMTSKSGVNKKTTLKLSDVEVIDEATNPVNNISVVNGTVTVGTP